jgi:hypothetical protein
MSRVGRDGCQLSFTIDIAHALRHSSTHVPPCGHASTVPNGARRESLFHISNTYGPRGQLGPGTHAGTRSVYIACIYFQDVSHHGYNCEFVSSIGEVEG